MSVQFSHCFTIQNSSCTLCVPVFFHADYIYLRFENTTFKLKQLKKVKRNLPLFVNLQFARISLLKQACLLAVLFTGFLFFFGDTFVIFGC